MIYNIHTQKKKYTLPHFIFFDINLGTPFKIVLKLNLRIWHVCNVSDIVDQKTEIIILTQLEHFFKEILKKMKKEHFYS